MKIGALLGAGVFVQLEWLQVLAKEYFIQSSLYVPLTKTPRAKAEEHTQIREIVIWSSLLNSHTDILSIEVKLVAF